MATCTLAIVQDAVRPFVWRRGVLGQKVLAGGIAADRIGRLDVWRGERDWIVGVAGGAGVHAAGADGADLAGALSAIRWGGSNGCRSPTARIAIGDGGIGIVSGPGSGVLAWTATPGMAASGLSDDVH
ncbi:hypothetical protein ACFONL_15625 [Camelimonas fluminis]|uniref:Uncharacterized protein n=1 Tax=Camelimonas fluminis TaxID=1576911 RepID=A0ABV7UJ74_9HYPH|nr:hypothetical protein [Camelimonas fluminis]